MDEKARIGVMDSILFAINLEVMLLQMRILESSDERCFSKQEIRTKREKQLREKLLRDRKNIKHICRRTLLELVESGDYYTLRQALDMLISSSNSGKHLRTQYEHLKESLGNITMELQKNRQQWKDELRNCDVKIAFLRDNLKDITQNSRLRFDYVDKWLDARAESLELQLKEHPTTPPRLDNENCVHNELLRAYSLQIKERDELLQYWKQRYAKDVADIDARLSKQCEKLRITSTRRAELESLYKLHEGEMRAWLTFKRERAARLAREERLRRAATRLQAWWRGVMVRRALGPFRYLRNVKKSAIKTKKK